jgi:tRNA(Ile)-lysidine synthase
MEKIEKRIKEIFLQTMEREKLIQKKDKIIVAVSGGPDSVALLFLLLEIKEQYSLKLVVSHINHKLRGEESDQDKEFVKNLCKESGIEFFSKSFLHIKEKAKKSKISLQEYARELRYDHWEKLAQKIGAEKIAVGHNLDDQVETILMRLLRGAGSLGLSGIPIKRGKIIRPLLWVKREQIETYLQEKRIPFRRDSSNLKPDYFRNKLRLLFLPLIQKEFSPNFYEILSRTGQILLEQERFIHKETEKVFNKSLITEKPNKIVLDLSKIKSYDICLKRNLIRVCLSQIQDSSKELSFQQTERILNLMERKESGKKVNLDKNIFAEVSGKQIGFYQRREKPLDFTLTLPGEKRVEKTGLLVNSEILNRKSLPLQIKTKDEFTVYLDWDKLKYPIHLRNKKPGDYFSPLGMKGKKKLSDFLIDLKIPNWEKEETLVLTSKDKIVWVLGKRISEEFKVTSQTKKVLRITARLD